MSETQNAVVAPQTDTVETPPVETPQTPRFSKGKEARVGALILMGRKPSAADRIAHARLVAQGRGGIEKVLTYDRMLEMMLNTPDSCTFHDPYYDCQTKPSDFIGNVLLDDSVKGARDERAARSKAWKKAAKEHFSANK